MKRALIIILIFLILTSLAACGLNKKTASEISTDPQSSATSMETPDPAEAFTPAPLAPKPSDDWHMPTVVESANTEHLYKSTQSIKTWKTAYSDFLLGVETNNYIEREYIVPSDYDIPPAFYLYDIDKDGIPELILITDDGDWENACCEVFTYINDDVQKLGNMKFDWFGSFGVSGNLMTGLYCDDGYKGHYGNLYHYTIQNGVLTEKIVWEYNFRPGIGEKGYIYIYDDDGVIQRIIEDNETDYAENSSVVEEMFDGYSFFKFYQITKDNISEMIEQFE